MGFLDDVAADLEGGGSNDYVNGAEKRDIAAKSVPFTISGVVRGKTRYNDDAFTLDVQLAGDDRKMEFAASAGEPSSRDLTLQKVIDNDETATGPVGPVTLRLVQSKAGNDFYLFAPAS